TTEPQEIKKEIKKHFEEWTKSNPMNNNYWKEWIEQYTPQKRINKL
ncbi:24001_t:CDS:1, partial [Cetraspora pellucida]